MQEYTGVMYPADEVAVFYSKHALELKRMSDLPKEVVEKGFGKKGIHVFNQRSDLEQWLNEQDYTNSVLLLMSSGNYDWMDLEGLVQRIIAI